MNTPKIIISSMLLLALLGCTSSPPNMSVTVAPVCPWWKPLFGNDEKNKQVLPDGREFDDGDFSKAFEEAFDKNNAYTEKQFNELLIYYSTEYLPKRKKEISIESIPVFPIDYIAKNGKYLKSEKYDFLAGAFYGWHDAYLGQTATRLYGRDALVDGYYYGIAEAVKELKKNMTSESRRIFEAEYKKQIEESKQQGQKSKASN